MLLLQGGIIGSVRQQAADIEQFSSAGG